MSKRHDRRTRQEAQRNAPIAAPDTTPSGNFRHPFKIFMVRKGSLVSVDRGGNALVQGDVVAAVIRNPAQLQKLANELTAGKYLCTPYAFTMQVANGIAQACRGLVDEEGLEFPYPTDERKEQDNAEDSKEGEDEGAGEAGSAGSDG